MRHVLETAWAQRKLEAAARRAIEVWGESAGLNVRLNAANPAARKTERDLWAAIAREIDAAFRGAGAIR